jgi:hypothetical protein
MKNPYSSLPKYCFWSKSMSDIASWQVNPVTKGRLIKPGEKVSTMGSCFAQHLAKFIASVGLDYYIPEQAPTNMSLEEASRKNYNVFSARYGNVYTVRQALQLFQRAFGIFNPSEKYWEKGQLFVDPFRPQIDPDCYSSTESLLEDQNKHLSYVRDIFTESSWIVFTLGLTEAWQSKIDGSIFPAAPGVAGGNFDPIKYAFKNFNIEEVKEDLFKLINLVTEINPKVTFLLTVSPVPLIATYEDRHVWASTTYSKSVLRVATDEAERAFKNVIYFPSYEIITSPAAGNTYFEDDLRQVKDIGVAHVMRTFSSKFLDSTNKNIESGEEEIPVRTITLKNDIICDEEILDRIQK